MKAIIIRAGSVELPAELNEGPTAKLIWEALPIKGNASRWGDEIYFSIPVKTGSEPGAQEDVDVGALGYWPPGHAFCIFFGPTPASGGSAPRAASPVNLLGLVVGDAARFKAVRDGDPVTIERTEG